MNTHRTVAGTPVFNIGLGCMNISHAYGIPPEEKQGIAILNRAFELGISHFDTAALYGFGNNERLLAKAIKPWRDQIQLCSKGGMAGVDGVRVIDGRPETLRKNLEDSLARLGEQFIDLYYLHRWDKTVPIEDSIGELSKMVSEGKIGAIGLSEVSADTLKKAHAVHPIAAVQSEYSLWSRNPEIAVLKTCEEIGASFVAFSPLARGYLSGELEADLNLTEKDIRRGMPRFQSPHWESNLVLLEQFKAICQDIGSSMSQVSLAWLLHQSESLIVIPGTTQIRHLEDNIGAANLAISDQQLKLIDNLFAPQAISGNRYNAATMSEIDTEDFS